MRVSISAFLESKLGEIGEIARCIVHEKYWSFNFLIGLWDAKILRQGLDTADVYPKAPRVIPVFYGVH